MKSILSLFFIGLVSCTAPLSSVSQSGFGLGYNFVTQRFGLPLFDMTYKLGQTATLNGTTYEVPDQAYYTRRSGGKSDDIITIVKTVKQYFDTYWSDTSLYVSAKIDGVTPKLAFGVSTNQINNMLDNHTANFAVQYSIFNEFQLEMYPGAPLNPMFAATLKKLPSTYDETTYKRVIDYWGTHFLGTANYGAKTNFTTSFQTSLLDKYSMNWISEQVTLSLQWNKVSVGVNGSYVQNHTKVSQAFDKASHTYHAVVGGDAYLFNSGAYGEWWASVQKNFGIIMQQSSLIPIWSLVDDTTVAANLKKAVLLYSN